MGWRQVVSATIHHGDCREVMRTMPAESVHAICTDPPYGLSEHSEADVIECLRAWLDGKEYEPKKRGFMGKAWDGWVPGPTYWREAYRVLKPGGHLVAFAGTRTSDLMGIAIRLAGFEIRDTPQFFWTFGSGFPKSHNVSKAIDKARNDDVRPVCRFLRAAMDAAGIASSALAPLFDCHPRMIDHWAARDTDSQPCCPTWDQWLQLKEALALGDEMDAEVWRLNGRKGQPGEAWLERPITGTVEEWEGRANYALTSADGLRRDIAITEAAKEWDGFGTALKPAYEPIILARKPLVGTVAANVLAHGCGALNIDGCRVDGVPPSVPQPAFNSPTGHTYGMKTGEGRSGDMSCASGRWPANLLLGCACSTDQHAPDCAVALLDAQSGEAGAAAPVRGTEPSAVTDGIYGDRERCLDAFHDDFGGASRFFYTAKATRTEREAGLEHRVRRVVNDGRTKPIDNAYQRAETQRANIHPTVKPVSLMRWLVRLVGGKRGSRILDPFCGSGTTGIACVLEGFDFDGVDLEAEHCDIARGRILAAHEQAGTASAAELETVPERTGPVQLGLLGGDGE